MNLPKRSFERAFKNEPSLWKNYNNDIVNFNGALPSMYCSNNSNKKKKSIVVMTTTVKVVVGLWQD